MAANDNQDIEQRLVNWRRRGLIEAIGEESSSERRAFTDNLASDRVFANYVRIALVECRLNSSELVPKSPPPHSVARVSEVIQTWAEGRNLPRHRFRIAFFTESVLPLLQEKIEQNSP